jgi:3-oxoacyl-[acyl-carrier protein] reductase
MEELSGDIDGETCVLAADVTAEDAVSQVVTETIDRYGPITGLVNNAGIGLLSMYNEQSCVQDIDTADFRMIMEVNVTGVFLFSKYVIPSMIDAGQGNIINISSGLGRRGAAKWGPYVASKWAVEGLTRTMAAELGEQGVNVNALDPGGRVATGFWNHLPETEHSDILKPDVMNDAATRLLAQGPNGITGKSKPADQWTQQLMQ